MTDLEHFQLQVKDIYLNIEGINLFLVIGSKLSTVGELIYNEFPEWFREEIRLHFRMETGGYPTRYTLVFCNPNYNLKNFLPEKILSKNTKISIDVESSYDQETYGFNLPLMFSPISGKSLLDLLPFINQIFAGESEIYIQQQKIETALKRKQTKEKKEATAKRELELYQTLKKKFEGTT